MRKLLVASVAGLMLMAAAGAQTAMAAPWRAPYRGHYAARTVARPVYRSAFVHPHFYHAPVFRNYCW